MRGPWRQSPLTWGLILEPRRSWQHSTMQGLSTTVSNSRRHAAAPKTNRPSFVCLGILSIGNLFRLGPWDYAVAAQPPALDASALADRLQRRPDGITVQDLGPGGNARSSDLPEGFRVALIDAVGRAAQPEPGQRAVIDAAFAVRTASLAAEAIADSVLETLADMAQAPKSARGIRT